MSLPQVSLLRTGITLALALSILPGLTGCLVLDSGSPADVPVVVNNLKIKVRSGQHPVVGASIQLYEADLTSYTGTSAARLPNPVVTGKDGNYVASTVLVCNPKSLFYLVATGGDAGAGDNATSALMTAVGSCDDLATSSIVLNEATTVASAYALSGFMSSATGVSANATVGTNNGTKLALTGITNAFDLVHNLVNIHTGATLAVTASGNGVVPQGKIDTLANILAACIESPGITSTACTGLTANAPSMAGVAPTDTIQASLNIAHNPGANVAALYALAPGTPYTPALTVAPNDLTLSIVYQGSGTGLYQGLAADSRGHIWATATSTTDTGSVIEFNPRGKVETTYTGATTGISTPMGIAIDPMNNVWVENCGIHCNTLGDTNSLTKIVSGGPVTQNFPQVAGLISSAHALASDGAGNIYSGIFTSGANQAAVEKYTTMGVPVGGNYPLSGSSSSAVSLAFDGVGNLNVLTAGERDLFYTPSGTLTRTVNVPNLNGGISYFDTAFDHMGDVFGVGDEFAVGRSFNLAFEITPTGSAFNQYSITVPGGINFPQGVIVDGAGMQWLANSGSTDVTAFTSAGTAFSPNSPPPQPPFFNVSKIGGFQTGFSGASSIVVDIAGNVWINDIAGTRVAEYVGAATPVTPLAVGVRDNTVGQRP
jgi:hypothetical protein